jgi:hypothetical protein
MKEALQHPISLSFPPLSVLLVPARPRPHDKPPPFLRSRTHTDGNWDLELVTHSGRCMSGMIRRLDRMWPVVHFSIYYWTCHPSMFGEEASNVVRVQQYRPDSWRRGYQVARCDRWDKGGSLLYDDRSIHRFDGCFPRRQSNLGLVPLDIE